MRLNLSKVGGYKVGEMVVFVAKGPTLSFDMTLIKTLWCFKNGEAVNFPAELLGVSKVYEDGHVMTNHAFVPWAPMANSGPYYISEEALRNAISFDI